MLQKFIALSIALTLALLPVQKQSEDILPENRQILPENRQILRLHIIANSDSPFDQQTKLAVRNAVLEYEKGLGCCASAAETRAAIMRSGGGLLERVEAVLASCGADYGAQLYLGVFDFPDRTYAEEFYPAGRYEALRIVLGAGGGQNWWCVMFPPLCILELPGGEIDYEGLKTNSYLIKLLESIDGGNLWKELKQKLGLR